MSKTNCINCGAAKEVSDKFCPFCGTKYADFTTFDIMHDDTIYIQLNSGGKVITAKAYITNRTMEFHPITLDVSNVSGCRRQIRTGMDVNGTIEFVLEERL